MKIVIVRHGDPDYAIDGLTAKGQREAELLSDRLCKENIKKIYCSTLGRAKLTAEPTLKKLKIDVEYCSWLREFSYETVSLPYLKERDCCWDILPSYINGLGSIYSPTDWMTTDFIKNSGVYNAYLDVCREFDRVLESHGYKRDKYNYIVERPNHDTLVFVCHFGLTAVLLSHLMNCSPYTIWQHVCTPPTAVSVLYTEEREEGIALFRAGCIGDTSHLYAAGEEIAFSARFCECFTDNTRHH